MIKRSILLLLVLSTAACGGAKELSNTREPIPYTQRQVDAQFTYQLLVDENENLSLQVNKPTLYPGFSYDCEVITTQELVNTDTTKWKAAEPSLRIELPGENIYSIIARTTCIGSEGEKVMDNGWSSVKNYTIENGAPFQFQIGNEISSTKLLVQYQEVSCYYMGNKIEKARLEYFGTDFKLPKAAPLNRPFKAEQKEALSSEYISGEHTFSEAGHYRLYYDNNSIDILIVDPAFPKITNARELARTLRFITKNEEYKKIIASDRVKTEIDQFWINLGGSEDRAKVLIKEFYSRVERANLFFTQTKPGWMSDRGMLYIVYGQPDIVTTDGAKETWEYINYLDETFSFDFEESNGELVFPRSSIYAETWNRSVYNWRNGIISKLSF